MSLCIEETFAIDGGLGILSSCALACEVGADAVLAGLAYETDDGADDALDEAFPQAGEPGTPCGWGCAGWDDEFAVCRFAAGSYRRTPGLPCPEGFRLTEVA